MAADDAPKKQLPQIAIYPEDKEDLDDIFGQNVSYPKRIRAMIGLIREQRLVEKARRRILGAMEPLAEGVPDNTCSEDEPPENPPADGDKGV